MRLIDTPASTLTTGYLLLDPANLDVDRFGPLPAMLRCTPAPLSNADALMPRLVDLATLKPEQQEHLTLVLQDETVGPQPAAICAWIDSALDITALARHVARFLFGPDADGNPIYWRYHDPRVFSLAALILFPAQLQALLGPVTQWRLPWCGRWWAVTGSGQQSDPLDGIAPAWPNPAQWSSLAHSVCIHTVMDALRDEAPTWSAADHEAIQVRTLQGLRYAVERLKLGADADLAEFALLYVRHGNAFLRHRKLSLAWGELEEGKRTWPQLRALVTEEGYAALPTGAYELELPTERRRVSRQLHTRWP